MAATVRKNDRAIKNYPQQGVITTNGRNFRSATDVKP